MSEESGLQHGWVGQQFLWEYIQSVSTIVTSSYLHLARGQQVKGSIGGSKDSDWVRS